MRIEHIGDATLYLGDCLEIMPTLGRVDAVITDPPYGIGLANHGAFKGDFSIVGDRDTSLANAISEWSVKRGISAVMFCSPDIQYDGKWNSRLVWHKPGRGIGGDWERCWLRDWEMVLVRAVKPIRKKESSVLRFMPAKCEYHKCEKPVELMAYLINQVSNPGDTILDPFMGSGTTGVACANLDRKFIGIEIEEKYFDIACERIASAYKQPWKYSRKKTLLSEE